MRSMTCVRKCKNKIIIITHSIRLKKYKVQGSMVINIENDLSFLLKASNVKLKLYINVRARFYKFEEGNILLNDSM